MAAGDRQLSTGCAKYVSGVIAFKDVLCSPYHPATNGLAENNATSSQGFKKKLQMPC